MINNEKILNEAELLSIKRLRQKKVPYIEISERIGISEERVKQICKVKYKPKDTVSSLVDKNIIKLSKMQVEFLKTNIASYDYNEISDMIGNLKVFMTNCKSYNL